ncbi:unnamed protein product [Schistosoma margrebowiei]|uniref:Uncharacterized protein n=1 Tax=Schistosoma margrebowiei TaxID=48269 RepID=A0A183M8S5_9TREM|nr:unnamed protein product [Schistosoma margrebowiei]
MGSSILREQMANEPIVGHRLPWNCISLRCSTALWIRPSGRRLGENLLLQPRYDVPGSDISTVVLTEGAVLGHSPPEYHRVVSPFSSVVS